MAVEQGEEVRYEFFYKWYDMWIGAYYDEDINRLYFCFLGFGVWFQPRGEYCGQCEWGMVYVKQRNRKECRNPNCRLMGA